jgi:enamine deaminase RidA (YjgF/YER057c/UK114 family)
MIGRLICNRASASTRNYANRIRSRPASSTTKRIGVDDPRMSRIVVNNDVVYISGQTDATGENIKDQTKNVLAKVDSLLMEAGTDKSKLLTSSIWLKDIERDFKGMNSIWNEWLDPDNKPVRATVEANMARPVLLIEVQVTAAIA